nr:type VI secretion protein [Rhodoblastus acidophilus]
MLACRAVVSIVERLACYDALALKQAPPRFQGSHNAVTELFTLDRPHRLRFRSDGVIFVLYLMNAAGEVIQNLHIGGAGEDDYLIDKPGAYQLRINGAEAWRIWLDPE